MPRKLRTLVHVLIILAISVGLLYLGLRHLPAMFGLLWIGFVFILCVGALHSVLGPPPSYSRPANASHRLTRSRDHWLIAGVCGGIAEFLGWQPGVVRGLWMLGSLLSAGVGGLVVYTILAFVMPSPPHRGGKFHLEDFRAQ